MDNEEIKKRAVEYFKTLNIPDKCPEQGCSGMKAWEVGEPQRIRDRVNYSQKGAKREADTVRQYVLYYCGQCRKPIARYPPPA